MRKIHQELWDSIGSSIASQAAMVCIPHFCSASLVSIPLRKNFSDLGLADIANTTSNESRTFYQSYSNL